jgi:putative transposase
MANTYTQIYLQLVFTPSGFGNIIPHRHKTELHKYATGIIQNRGHKLLAINCMPDHVHILIGYNPTQALPGLMQELKAVTSKFINEQGWMPGRFSWQEGYGSFSYSRSQIHRVIRYIDNQEEHHKKVTFREEYMEFLKRYEVEYEEKFLFKWIDLQTGRP